MQTAAPQEVAYGVEGRGRAFGISSSRLPLRGTVPTVMQFSRHSDNRSRNTGPHDETRCKKTACRARYPTRLQVLRKTAWRSSVAPRPASAAPIPANRTIRQMMMPGTCGGPFWRSGSGIVPEPWSVRRRHQDLRAFTSSRLLSYSGLAFNIPRDAGLLGPFFFLTSLTLEKLMPSARSPR